MPITSHQAAGMIGGQQAMFGNFASYAQQISPYNPGLAPTYANPMAGAGGGFTPPPPPTSSPMTTTMGPTAMSAMAGAVAPVAAGIGMAGSFLPGKLGSAFGMLDPFSAGLSGASAATGIGFGKAGMLSRAGWANFAGGLGRVASGGLGGIARAGFAGIGGAAAAAAPIMALTAGAQYLGGQMVQGAQFGNQVFGDLQSQFRHVNPQSRTGFGFSREQAGSISDMLQDMGAKDMMTNAQELRRVMGGAMQMGLMKAVQDVKEFKSRFKKTVGALKEIAETMNTTLEGAMPFFSAARQAGFWTPQDIMRNASSARMTAQATGMSVAQVQQMQTQGAQMARSVGAMGATGARGMASTLQLVGGAVRGGVLSTPELAEATGGLTGTEAVGSLAGTLQAATTRFAASRRGRWMLAALGRDKFSQLDPAKLQQFTEGRLSVGQIGSMARRNINQQGAFNFVSNERDLRGDLLQRGPEAQLGLIRGVIGKHLYGGGARSEYITRRIMKRWFGVSGRQADVLTKMAREAPNIMRENEARSAQQMDAMERQREEVMDRSWEGAKRKMSQWWDENVSAPVQKMGDDMNRAIGDWWTSTTDRFWGRTPAHRRFRGIQGGAIRAIQRSILGDTRALTRSFGSSAATRQFGAGTRGGGLGMALGDDTPSTGGLTGTFAGGGGGGFGGGGWGQFWGGMANMGMGWVGMGTRTNAAIETARRWGVSERGFRTSEEREAAIANEGLLRGAYRGVGDYNYRAMDRREVESMRMGLMGATGILTRRTTAAMGMGGDVKGARGRLLGVQDELKGDLSYRAAAVRAQMGGGTGREQLGSLVSQIRAGKVGGERLRELVGRGDPAKAAMRLAAAQRVGGAGTQVDLSEDLKDTDVVDVTSERAVVEAEDKAKWAMAYELVGGKAAEGAGGPMSGIMGTATADKQFEDKKKGAFRNLEQIEKKGGERYQEALRLMDGDAEDRKKGQGILMDMAEGGDFSDAERDIILRMADPKDPSSKSLASAASKMGKAAKNRLGRETVEGIKRRHNRFRKSMGKNQEAILSIFDKVKTNRDGGASIGSKIRQIISEKASPHDIGTKLTDLVRSASEADTDELQRAMSFLGDTRGGEHIKEALRQGLSSKQDIESWTKGGRGSTRAGFEIGQKFGIDLRGKLKTLRRGGAQAGKMIRELTSGIEDTQHRRLAQQALEAMGGEQTDEKKQALLNAMIKGGAMSATGQLGSPESSLLAKQRRQNRESLEAGEMYGQPGSLKGIHGELTRQTVLLELIRKGEEDPKSGLGGGGGAEEKRK